MRLRVNTFNDIRRGGDGTIARKARACYAPGRTCGETRAKQREGRREKGGQIPGQKMHMRRKKHVKRDIIESDAVDWPI